MNQRPSKAACADGGKPSRIRTESGMRVCRLRPASSPPSAWRGAARGKHKMPKHKIDDQDQGSTSGQGQQRRTNEPLSGTRLFLPEKGGQRHGIHSEGELGHRAGQEECRQNPTLKQGLGAQAPGKQAPRAIQGQTASSATSPPMNMPKERRACAMSKPRRRRTRLPRGVNNPMTGPAGLDQARDSKLPRWQSTESQHPRIGRL